MHDSSSANFLAWRHVFRDDLSHNLTPCAHIVAVSACADDSGSMAFEENGERINDLKLILGRVRKPVLFLPPISKA